jgi:hypothetical protein
VGRHLGFVIKLPGSIPSSDMHLTHQSQSSIEQGRGGQANRSGLASAHMEYVHIKENTPAQLSLSSPEGCGPCVQYLCRSRPSDKWLPLYMGRRKGHSSQLSERLSASFLGKSRWEGWRRETFLIYCWWNISKPPPDSESLP